MIIDNGTRVHLIIDGVFDGMAGLSRSVLAFVPNKGVKRPEDAVAGLMDGAPVRLTIALQGKGPFYGAKVYPL